MLTIVCKNICRLRLANSLRRGFVQEPLQSSIYGPHIYMWRVAARHYQSPVPHPRAEESVSGTTIQEEEQPSQKLHLRQQEQVQQVSLQNSESARLQGPQIENQGIQPPEITGAGKERAPTMSSGVDIPFNIDWIFPRLRNPTKLWYVASQIIITAVGLFSKLVLVLMNRTRVYNKERLVSLVGKRPKGVPLVTVSNHHSCFDDPGLWGVLPVRYVCNTWKIRWSMAAHDICFTNKYHSLFFLYGKCIPVVRGIGVYQEAINLCIEKCALGHWVHVFPEGKVNMTKEEMRLKWGVGRIIYESPKMPIILPMWHLGMDDVLPNVEPYMLKWRKKVTLNIGQPLDLNDFVQELKAQQVPEPTARKLITDKIQDAFRDLRLETEELHNQRN